MIKILPSGTSGIAKYGLKPIRSSKARGRLGDGAKEHTFEMSPVVLHTRWKGIRLEADLVTGSELYIRSITLEFRFRSPRHPGDTTLWTEGYSDELKTGNLNSTPGSLSQKTSRNGAWALWISEAADTEGIFFRQSPPEDYPVRFYCKPLARVLKITWELNRMFIPGETLKLPDIGISRGSREKIFSAWKREWVKTSHRELITDRRVGWCGGMEIQSPKDLREILTVIRSRRIKVDWFSVGPDYASEVGDWLLPSDAFKDRMGSLSRTIGEQSMIPGLRFAPFLISKKSVFADENRDWLVKAPNGSPVTVPGYTGEKETLYVLDVSRPEVINHIRKTLSVMRDQWGFRAYYLERINSAAVPGIREDNSIGGSGLIKTAAAVIREALGNKVLVVGSGLPLMTTADIWDARVLTPPIHLLSGFSSRKKRKLLLSVTSALLHNSTWNESTWINASGLLPLDMFSRESGLLTHSLKTAVILSCGMVCFSGDPRTVDDESRDSIGEFLDLFNSCRTGKLSLVPNIGGGNSTPLIVRNSTGRVGLFNLSYRKKEIRLGRDELKSNLGVSSALSAGEKTVFNSPEIHVVLPPMGYRLFRG